MPKLEPYRKELSYSYALGIFAAMHLLVTRPEVASRLLLHPAGLKSEGVNKLREKCAALGIREEEAERVLHASTNYGTDAPILLEVVLEKATYQILGDKLMRVE